MSYTAIAGRAVRTVARKGAAVSFTLASGSYTEATDTWSAPSTTTVDGYAVEVQGNPDVYDRLSLIQSESPSLLFTPSTYGAMPKPGYAVIWGGTTYTVRDVSSVSPDGNTICATVVVAQ